MALLKFKGVPEHRIPKPGAVAMIGQFPEFAGLERQADGSYVPVEFDVESDTPVGLRLMKLARRDASLCPANEAAAQALGIDWAQPRKAKAS